MKTQISRLPDTLHTPWSGVYQQQGRMIADADWNALTEVMKARLNDALFDIVGSGSPDRGGIVASDGAGNYELVWGTAYAEGIGAVIEADPPAPLGDPFNFAQQRDFPGAPAQPATPHLLYLDVWERAVTGLEEADLMDPALHGADTTTRTRTMAQVKWAPSGFDAEDPAQNPPIGQALLTLTLRQGSITADPCEPCADEIELQDRVGNYLFRVEIHDVGYDASGSPERVVLKWSRENGAEAAKIGDEPPGFIAGDWIYDFYHGAPAKAASESHLGYHHPDVLAAWAPTRSELTEGYPDSPPADFSLVRRWDGYAELEKVGTAWELTTILVDGEAQPKGKDRNQRLSAALGANDHGHVLQGANVLINLDTTTLEIEIGDLQMLAGDYWFAEVREAVDEPGDPLITDQPPMGIEHHYMCIAEIDGATVTPLSKDDCRRYLFPRLTDITGEDVCYDNSVCDMPGVETVQEALDHLCQQRDLRFHNKHLHGWGIVCGLIVECCPELEDEDIAPQNCVIVTKGYALTCEGEDVVLETPLHIDLIDEVNKHDEEALTPILVDGEGTACLVIALDGGEPVVRVEPHTGGNDGFLSGLLDGTLLGDILQDCVLDLVEALSDELTFISDDGLDNEPLISPARRKFIAFGNLAIQFANLANGAYVWLSPREHRILKNIYDGLRALLKSKTFCAMFQADEFPDYPFPATQIDTWFGRNNHTRIKRDPTGKRIYTYGGADATINVYDANKGELVEVLTMPTAEGAEITAIALTPDGALLYAAASIRGQDSILGAAQVGDTHVWEKPMIVLCDIEIAEMTISAKDKGLIYAIGLNRGLFFLRPEVLKDQATPKPDPIYAFDAAGHMVIDPAANRVFATAAEFDKAADDGVYDAIAVMSLDAPDGTGLSPTSFRIIDVQGAPRVGDDGLTLKPAANSDGPSRLYVAVNPPVNGDDKAIVTIDVPAKTVDDVETTAQLEVEDTQIALAYNAKADRLMAAFEDSYRVETVTADGLKVIDMRVPVQIQPVDIIVAPEGDSYVLNFLSNTITFIPLEELAVPAGRLTALANYRHQILLAFYALFGGLLQYLKDCVCHHLLIKCPECDESEKIYLACVDIREEEVFNICNFGKRKYVKSFPAVDYWMSIFPIAPLIHKAISKLCCAILPNFFDKFLDNVAPPPPPPTEGAQTGVKGAFTSRQARDGVVTWKRTDFNVIKREQTSGLKVYGRMASDVAIGAGASGSAGQGIRKKALLDAPVIDAERELQAAGVNVIEIRPYDPTLADSYITDFAQTPNRLPKGANVVIYEKDGKAVFFAEEKTVVIGTLDPATEVKLAELDARKNDVKVEIAALEDQIETLNTERAAEETRIEAARASNAALKAEMTEISAGLESMAATEAELTELVTSKDNVEVEIVALKSQLTTLNTERAAEETRIEAARASNAALKAEMTEISAGLESMATTQKILKRKIDSSRPVSDLRGVTAELAKKLNRAGIHTIGELAESSGTKLRTAGVVDNATEARALITEAKNRLK